MRFASWLLVVKDPRVCMQELTHREEALIAYAKWDLDTASATSFDLFYFLVPASNTCALLARR